MAMPVTVKTPVDGLRILSFRITERLSELFEGELVLESDAKDGCLSVPLEDLVGYEVSVTVVLEGEEAERHFHGFVANATLKDHNLIRARVVPFAWLLTRSHDIRIFQNMSVPEIVKKVISDYGFDGDLVQRQTGTYQKRVYCTQYRESDYDFIARLLEDEGIYFFFEHEKGKHSMVLADSLQAHSPVPDFGSLPYLPPSQARTSRAHVHDFGAAKSVVAAKYAHTDYFFTQPAARQATDASAPQAHGKNSLEVYDYPGNYAYLGTGEGKRLAERRLEALQVPYATFRGVAQSRSVTCGTLLTLTDHPRDDFNAEYLVTGTVCDITLGGYSSGSGGFSMDVTFDGIESSRPFRQSRKTPKPKIYGPHTAQVVGPSGEEIHTDEHGRVLVQFHWDRLGNKDEKSSVWIRVSQPWAGEAWGAVALPRIGQEVIVEFLEGDPDWPVITGRLYNATNKPPYALPDNKTQSGMRSRSSPNGGQDNYNELMFEDKKGSELIRIQAEKDLTMLVKNDETVEVKRNRTRKVGGEEKIEVIENQTETIGKNQVMTVKQDRSVQVKGKEDVKIDVDQTTKIGMKMSTDVGQEISFKTGMSSLVMKADGTITLKGMKITIDGSLESTVKGGVKVVVDGGVMVDVKGGAMLKLNGGATADLSGGAMTKISGAVVMIN